MYVHALKYTHTHARTHTHMHTQTSYLLTSECHLTIFLPFTYLCISFTSAHVYLLLSTDKSISVLGINGDVSTVGFEPDTVNTCGTQPFEDIFVLLTISGVRYPLIGMCNRRYCEVQMIMNCGSTYIFNFSHNVCGTIV